MMKKDSEVKAVRATGCSSNLSTRGNENKILQKDKISRSIN